MGETLMSCPNCGEEAPAEAKFCEACGHDLNAVVLPACVACGEREVAEEGYCLSCGHKQPEERDHMTFRDGAAVAVTDRGKRHRHNEDSAAIAVTDNGFGVIVVCDGVSSTSGSAEASLRAASAARDLLVLGLSDQSVGGGDTDPAPETTAAEEPDGRDGRDGEPTAELNVVGQLLIRATEAAQVEASASTAEGTDGVEADLNPMHDGGSPSSTFVAVVAEPRGDAVELTTAWVGDSRAYWIGDEPQQLTGGDHELGGSLVRWLGADSINPIPELATATVDGPGHVVVCSDGLWRYAAEPRELSELVQRLIGEGRLGVDLAADMVAFANESGGHDNITVALWTNDDDLVGPDDDPETEPDSSIDKIGEGEE